MEQESITFAEFKEETAEDCESFNKILSELANKVREGNLEEFEKFWISGGTEEGDAKIFKLRELIVLRYFNKKELVK